MAKPEKRNREKISYFLGCFGFSRKIYSQKPMMASSSEGPKKTKKNKKTRWFSWSKFRLMNREIKPPPVDSSEKSKSNPKDESDYKQKWFPAISRVTDRKNFPADHKAARPESGETMTKEQKDHMIDNSKPVDPLSSSTADTCHNRVFSKIRGKSDRNTTGKSGSNPTRAGWLQQFQSVKATEDWVQDKPGRVNSSGSLRMKNGPSGAKFGPIVGLSIVMLTLVIMLIWGRLCAILCTSACCYFLSRVRDATMAVAVVSKRNRSMGERGSDPGDPDLDSEAYKRKVVFEGFLERKNRVSS